MSLLTRDQIYSGNNRPRILCLIMELRQRYDEEPIFTIRDEKEGLISLKKLFVSHCVDDPTEVSFAEAVFGNVGYWLEVRDIPLLKKHVDQWRTEADIVRKSRAFKALYSEVVNDGRAALTAAKYLIEEPWKERKDKAKSRKTSEEAATKTHNEYSEDFERLKEQGLIQ